MYLTTSTSSLPPKFDMQHIIEITWNERNKKH